MTDRPNIPKNKGIKLIESDGQRDKRGFNKKEADLIIERVKKIITEQQDLKQYSCKTIGILSPFPNQIDYLMKELSNQLSIAQIEKHNLLIGTAYSFQGEERDVMLLSFVLDDSSHPSAFNQINQPDVFNVSITRGRSLQYIYTSLNIKKLKRDSLLKAYLESISKDTIPWNDEKTRIIDRFTKSVRDELGKLKIKTWIAFPVAGMEIDIIIQFNDKIFGIDLTGYPGEFENAFSLERYKMFNRAGLKNIPSPLYLFCRKQRKLYGGNKRSDWL